ncbi:MAG: hypothetical protein ABR878_18725 [Roseiarcus sp.]
MLIGAAAPLLLAWPARAVPSCRQDPKLGANVCRAFIDATNSYQESFHASHDPRAIWIACVAVVFSIKGHVIQQPRILAEAYGSLDQIPIDAGFAVALPLARTWTDDDGVGFRASAELVFDDRAPGSAFDPKLLIGPLADGDPLILIGNEHPIVLTALAYTQTDVPGRMIAGVVYDPMPIVGTRSLDADEVVPDSAGGDLLLAMRTKLENA